MHSTLKIPSLTIFNIFNTPFQKYYPWSYFNSFPPFTRKCSCLFQEDTLATFKWPHFEDFAFECWSQAAKLDNGLTFSLNFGIKILWKQKQGQARLIRWPRAWQIKNIFQSTKGKIICMKNAKAWVSMVPCRNN